MSDFKNLGADVDILEVKEVTKRHFEVKFNPSPKLTKEHFTLNAALLGMTRQRVEECFEEVLEFSGIADFIDEPTRTYSSGMLMRLAFSVAIHGDPEVLIIDEVLAVGDQSFQARCLERLHEFRRTGRSLLFVSHVMPLIQKLCDRALWLDRGSAMLLGTPAEVLDAYSGSLQEHASQMGAGQT